ncbi:MAG: hypothetical protein QXH03_10875 [Candidatus Bathyarchaeia archaeon]
MEEKKEVVEEKKPEEEGKEKKIDLLQLFLDLLKERETEKKQKLVDTLG